jgi:hypothetical protein
VVTATLPEVACTSNADLVLLRRHTFGLTLSPAAGPGPRPAIANYRRLLIDLTGGDGRTGFVAAGHLQTTRHSALGRAAD